MTIAAGRLREQVTILRPVEAPNGRGGRTTTYEADPRPIFAEVIPLRGDEALKSGIQRGTQFYRVTIRFRADLGIKERLRWMGVDMNIRTAARTVERDGLVMTTESGGLG